MGMLSFLNSLRGRNRAPSQKPKGPGLYKTDANGQYISPKPTSKRNRKVR